MEQKYIEYCSLHFVGVSNIPHHFINFRNKYKGKIMRNLIEIKENKVLTTSLKVAEKFEKEHSKVLRNIKELIEKIGQAKNGESNFYIKQTTYSNSQNKEQPLYEFNKDFFTLLVMGLTGEKALKFKIDYINAFNQMEQQLKIKQPLLTSNQQKALSKLKDMLKDVGCLLTWNDLIEIQHKATVKDVCQYLASNYFVNVGNISNSLRELESNYINEYLLKK